MAATDTTEAFDIVVIGEAPLDVILDFSPPVKRPGGAMYSASAAVARGAKVGVISEVGSDQIDGWLGKLRDLGINMEGVEQLLSEGLSYRISNSDEVIPQTVIPYGSRMLYHRTQAFPPSYLDTRSLLIYPHRPELLMEIARSVRAGGGNVFLDLQHDITDLSAWKEIIDQCKVVFASRNELLCYTEAETELEAVDRLRQLGASVVVVKYGMGGSAIYHHEGERILIPAFLARFQCTIGAGDIYNAVFALEYTASMELEKAGRRAAIAAALFSEQPEFNAFLKILSEVDFEKEMSRRISVSVHPEQLAKVKVYVAGHFLSTPTRMWVDRVVLALESRGFSVFSPYRDAGVLNCSADPQGRYRCFVNDLKAIGESQAIVALLDGIGHGGTSWEIGYAYAKGIPILGLCTDSSKPLSNMVEQSCLTVQATIRSLLNDLFSLLGERISLPSV
jgi:sugar/nucleoside kinase (ribokinase family)/nucleoside 2-deoxyribosyltransferase